MLCYSCALGFRNAVFFLAARLCGASRRDGLAFDSAKSGADCCRVERDGGVERIA